MKKVCLLLVALFLLVNIVACEDTHEANNPATTNITAQETEVVETASASSTPSIDSSTTTPEPTQTVFTERPCHVQMINSNIKVDYEYQSFIHIPVGITWGPDGYLYVSDWAGRHIVKVDNDGNVDDLGLWKTLEAMQNDGPSGIVFDSKENIYIKITGDIYRCDTDGNVEKLPGINGNATGSMTISPSDELFFTDRNNGKIFKWTDEKGPELIAKNIPNAENLVFGLDGTLYLTQLGIGDVIKIDINSKEKQVFVSNVCGYDPCFLAVDPEGDIWIRAAFSLLQFSPEGIEKPVIIDGYTFPNGPFQTNTSAGIAFDDEGGLWLASYNSRLVRLVPTEAGVADPEYMLDVIHPGFEAADLSIDANGVIYASNMNSGQILKTCSNNNLDILIEHNSYGRIAVSVDKNNIVYLGGMPGGEVVYIDEDGSLIHYAKLQTERMVFGADEVLYAVVENKDESRTIVSITAKDTVNTFVTEIAGIPLGSENVHITPALDNGLYVFTEDKRDLFFVDYEGNGYLIANLSELGGGGPVIMAASPKTGNIYIIPHGPYSLFEIDSSGNYEIIAFNIYGDPWGMIVSQDGKYLYIAESGAIIRMAL